MKKKFKGYTEEFRNEAVKLALDTSSVSKAASDLGIPSSTLHTWVNGAGVKNIGKKNSKKKILPSISMDEILEKNRQLQKRIDRLEQEKAILKKAATYFAKELG